MVLRSQSNKNRTHSNYLLPTTKKISPQRNVSATFSPRNTSIATPTRMNGKNLISKTCSLQLSAPMRIYKQLLLLAASLLLTACAQEPLEQVLAGKTMGTSWSVKY